LHSSLIIYIYVSFNTLYNVNSSHLITYCIERIMSTCTIYLSSESNASMLTAINLSVVRLIVEALSFKTEKDSVNFLY